MARAIYLDSFSTSLGDLKPRQQGDDALVLRALKASNGYFSTFDMNGRLQTTIERLQRNGKLRWDGKHDDGTEVGYPWHRVTILPEAPCAA